MAQSRFPVLSLLAANLLQKACASSITPPVLLLFVASPATNSPPEDENDPMTHVKRLSHIATRTTAVRHLQKLVNNALSADRDDSSGSRAKPLVDTTIGPLRDACMSGTLNESTNLSIMALVARNGDARGDARGEACLSKTLEHPTPLVDDEVTRMALHGLIPIESRNPDVFFDFIKQFRESHADHERFRKDIHDMVSSVRNPSWENPCIAMLTAAQYSRADAVKNDEETFKQETCAEMLGRLKSEKSVKLLVEFTISPRISMPASHNALVEIGKPSIAPLRAVLHGENKDLIEYARIEYLAYADHVQPAKLVAIYRKDATTGYIRIASYLLASMQREEVWKAMVEALTKVAEAERLVIVSDYLQFVPRTAATVAVVKHAIEQTPVDMRESLIMRLNDLYDANLVPRLVRMALTVKAPEKDVQAIREAALLSAWWLMREEHIPEVDKLANIKMKDAQGRPTTLGEIVSKRRNMVQGVRGA